MILGPFLLLLLSSLHNGGECEAGSITIPIIEHSKNVSNLTVVDDGVKESEPCPLSLPRGDEEAIHNHGNESQLPSPASLTVGKEEHIKEEKQETALEKITESISGVFSTFKNSVASIFSPGYGLPGQSEEATNCTSSSEQGITNATNTDAQNSNATEVEEEHHPHPEEDEDHKPKLEDGKEAESSLLIPSDVSSNDTNNSTNATQVTSTTSTTTTTPTHNTEKPEDESESKN